MLQELSSFMDPNLAPQAAPPKAEAVALDEATIALAEQAIRPPWYASWVGAVVILVLPVLLIIAGFAGGDANLQVWGIGGILFLFICGFPFLGLPWLALFLNYRDRVKGIRNAISTGRAWSRMKGRMNSSTRPIGSWTTSMTRADGRSSSGPLD